MRENGAGTIRMRKNGLFEAQYYFEGKRKSIYSRDKKELTAKLNRITADIIENKHIEPSNITLSAWLYDWLKTYALTYIRNSTLVSYETYIRGHISTHKIGDIKLKDLKPRDLQEFFNEKAICGRLDHKDGGLSPKTLNNIRVMLHEALEQAVEDELIQKSPLKVKKFESSKEMRFLELDEQQRLENVVEHSLEINSWGLVLILYTGMRVGELVGLRWTDVNFEQKYILVRHTLSRQNITKGKGIDVLKKNNEFINYEVGNETALLLGDVKTKSGNRRIDLSQKALEALNRLQNYQHSLNPLNSKKFNPYNFVICSVDGNPLEPRTYEDVFNRHIELAGITDATVHTLRHTNATRSIESGTDIVTLSGTLGHAKSSTTLDMYGHSSRISRRQYADNLDKIHL